MNKICEWLETVKPIEELEVTCEDCQGKGKIMNDIYCPAKEVACGACDGNGVILTEKGEQMVDFILRHIKVKFDGSIGR